MLKKLNGLYIYKLQYTSFFSIMQRVSGFILLAVLYYFFLQEVFLHTFFSFHLSYYFTIFSFLILLFIVFYFTIHFVNGLRIYFTALYFNYNLQKTPLTLGLLYSLTIVETNKFLKSVLNFIIKLLNFSKNFLVKSNSLFLLLILLVFLLIVIFILI